MDTGNEGIVNSNPEENSMCVTPKINSVISCDKNKEIKNISSEILENIQDAETTNIEQNFRNETTDKLSEPFPSEVSKAVTETLIGHDNSAVNITLKDEPYSEDIDYGMPIAKTPMHTSFSENCESLESENDNQNFLLNNLPLDRSNSKSALDEYLDGLDTPIAPPVPRLRVKTDLAFFKPPQAEAVFESHELDKDCESTNTVVCAPPPPMFSSNSNLGFVTDGIATPRISLTFINRLRVKSEFSLPPATEENNGEDPSDNLINTKNSLREDGEVSSNNVSDEASENEEIPSDYFDDLLIDKLKEKIDEAQNNDLEVKYSDRLKELERLRNELTKIEEKKARKSRKKQKKSKKKSRKRSRSRSLSPRSKPREKNLDDLPSSSYYDRNKRNRIHPLREEPASSSKYVSTQMSEENVSSVDSGFMNIKTEFSANEIDNRTRESLSNSAEDEEILTHKQKKERVIKRATALLHYLKNKSEDNSAFFSEFPFVSTVRKLPICHSFVQQQIYENRSPLHSVNNVSYKFNSHSSRFKMEEWGLASLPPVAAKLAKLVGCDADFIHNKLKTIKIPAKLMKLEQEKNDNVESEEEEELVETTSSLYSNAMTQTDDIDEFVVQRKGKGYDIGVQAKPEAYGIGSQTVEALSPTRIDSHKSDDLPLMKLIEDFNENQLMAIHSFAELIKDQKQSSNAMEMYKIQMQIMDIYKMSQMPSALEPNRPAIMNNNATTIRSHGQTNLCIQSVKGADGRQFTVNDPRSKSVAYSQRNVYDDVGSSSSSRSTQRYEQNTYPGRPPATTSYSQTYFSATSENDARYSSSTSPSLRHYPYNNQSTTTKRYGRGALRR